MGALAAQGPAVTRDCMSPMGPVTLQKSPLGAPTLFPISVLTAGGHQGLLLSEAAWDKPPSPEAKILRAPRPPQREAGLGSKAPPLLRSR